MEETLWLDLEPDQHGDTVLHVSFVLGKPVTETGKWNYPRMFFLFKGGAFLKRTIVERQPDVSERHLRRKESCPVSVLLRASWLR